MSSDACGNHDHGWFGDSRSQRRVGSALVVVDCELRDGLSQMPFVERNEIVQTVPANGSDQAFAICVCRWRPNRTLQNAHAAVADRLIDGGGKDRIAVMDQEFVRVVEGQKLAELLDTPISRRMRSDIGVQDTARADFHGDEYVQEFERGRDSDEEVAGHSVTSVVADEGGPALAGDTSAWRAILQILANCSVE